MGSATELKVPTMTTTASTSVKVNPAFELASVLLQLRILCFRIAPLVDLRNLNKSFNRDFGDNSFIVLPFAQ